MLFSSTWNGASFRVAASSRRWLRNWQRILGGRRTGLGPHRNFPPVTRSTAAAWKQALRDLAREHRALEAAVQKFPPARLDRKLSGGDHSFYFTMHGILQHDLYHAGQIAILRKGLRR